MKRALNQIETTGITISAAKRTDIKRMFLFNDCHPGDDINRVGRELHTICQKDLNARYNPSSIMIESEYVNKIGVDLEGETEGGENANTLSTPGC